MKNIIVLLLLSCLAFCATDHRVFSNLQLMQGNTLSVYPKSDIDNYTVLLIHSNTTEGSTTFTDSSFYNHAISAINGAIHSTDTAKFGASSIKYTGSSFSHWNGGAVQTPNSDDFNLGSGDFTIDLWVKFALHNGGGFGATFIAQESFTPVYSVNSFYLVDNAGLKLYFAYSTDGSNHLSFQENWSPATNTWYHLACVRNGANLYFFVNGNQLGTPKNLGSASLYYDSNGKLSVGGRNDGGSLNGYIDEFRLSKGIARWTSNFTPPNSIYE